MTFNEKIKEHWGKLDPKQKRIVSIALCCAVVLAGTIGLKSFKGKNDQPANKQTKRVEQAKDLSLQPGLLDKTAYMEQQKRMEDWEKKMKGEDKGWQVAPGLEAQPPVPGNNPAVGAGSNQKGARGGMPGPANLPYPPGTPGNVQQPLPPPPIQAQQGPPPAPVRMEPEYVGGIEILSNSSPKDVVAKDKGADKKKEVESVYLPSNTFMAATLLSGLDVPTMEGAKGEPVPVLIRVKDLAVLPNRVKANLQGCFFGGEGVGDLSTRRAKIRLTSLSCIDKKNHSVIDQPIEGYLTDGDGRVGLRGKVTSKMGDAILLSVIAGTLGGFGDAVKSTATTNSVSPLGATSTINTADMARAGLGAGLSQGFHDLQKFYMEIVRGNVPVIEIGATRKVTVVIKKGLNLEIKSVKLGGAL